jgi:hypothetical protein
MAGAFTAIYRREESPFIRATYSTYCARPARACQGKNDRSITRRTVSLLGEGTPIGTYPRSYYRCILSTFYPLVLGVTCHCFFVSLSCID